MKHPTINHLRFYRKQLIAPALAALSSVLLFGSPTQAANLVINEIYGGGGNSGAVYRNDFVELYNSSASAIDLSTYSIQYASATGTSWQVLNLSGSIAAGQPYLIKLASGGAIGSALPAENISGSINMSATAGKLALVSSQTTLTGVDPQSDPSMVDFVGFGTTANAFETAKATAPTVTNSISRAAGGVDTGNNSSDFSAGTPSPTAGPDLTPPTLASTSPVDNATNVSTTTNLVATFSETVQKGASGNVTIKKTSDNSTVQTIDVTTAAVSVAGAVVTIDPPSDLASGTEYYFTIDANAFKDNAASPNNYAGLSSTTAWSFTTAAAIDITPPTLVLPTSPADNAAGVAITSNLVATFSETVQKGASGNVTIKKTSDNSIVQTIDITTAAVTVSGAVVTIDPADLAIGTEYYVTIDAGAFKDTAPSPNNYTGLSSTTAWSFTTAAPLIPGQIAISQVYGGGGNTGATYTHDFIELHNNSAVTVNINGWSVQYAPAAGTFSAKTDLIGSIPPGGYFLVQGSSTAAVGLPLPTPDATGTLSLSAASGKVALVGNTTLLGAGGPTDPSVSDFVGFGTASQYEGAAAAPAGSNTQAVVRQNSGTLDTNVNSFDFVTAVPAPRNSATPTYTPTADGSGIATIANLTPASPLLNSPVFGSSLGSQTTAVTLTGTFPGSTITDVTIEVPAAITGLLVGNISLTGAGSASVTGNTITITGAAVTTSTGLTVTISGLSTPDTSLDIANDGNYSFAVSTAQSGGTLTAISSSPKAYVVIPIANIRDQDANGVPLDYNDKVAVQGVCTEEDFNSSVTVTSAYLQDGGNGVNIFSNSVDSPYVRGNEYVTLGNVIQFNGLTEVSFTATAGAVFDLGAATSPTPVTVTLATLMASPESYEGKLVTVAGLSRTSPTPAWATAAVIPLTDDGGTTILDIYIHTGSTATSEPFYPVSITGVLGQFDNSSPYTSGYELFPRDPADLVSSGLSPYQQWATGAPYNLSGGDAGFNADPDHDSVPNGIEFIVGGNPTVANDSNALLPQVSVAGTTPNRIATITFRTTAASDYLNPALQFSDDLIDWDIATVGPNVLSYVLDDITIPGVNLYTLQVNANDPKCFFRLFGEAFP
jgi:methionine-rich copper-binding protein CopC